jgi:hypothetical protein
MRKSLKSIITKKVVSKTTASHNLHSVSESQGELRLNRICKETGTVLAEDGCLLGCSAM